MSHPQRYKRPPLILLAAVGFVLCITALFALLAEPRGELVTVTIDTKQGPQSLVLELADNYRERQRGFQGRRFIDRGEGLFLYWPDGADVDIWMAETSISLDLVFVGEDGTVSAIVERVEPYSKASISAPGRIWGVIEIKAGVAGLRTIEVGNRVSRPVTVEPSLYAQGLLAIVPGDCDHLTVCVCEDPGRDGVLACCTPGVFAFAIAPANLMSCVFKLLSSIRLKSFSNCTCSGVRCNTLVFPVFFLSAGSPVKYSSETSNTAAKSNSVEAAIRFLASSYF